MLGDDSCPIWTGVDFSPCFIRQYLERSPIALIVIAGLIISVNRLRTQLAKRKKVAQCDVASLVSPLADNNLSRLEAEVTLSSVAGNLLPIPDKATTPRPLPARDAEKVIEDFVAEDEPAVKRWEEVHRWITPAGAAVFLFIQLASSIVTRQWIRLPFPAFILLVSLLPSPPTIPLLSLHLVPMILLLRHQIISGHASAMRTLPIAVEFAYWIVLISIPYADPLDRILKGGRTKGGSSSGSYGAKLPRHFEDPTSAFSKTTYTFLIPFLLKYYWTPITLEDIPALREDDTSAACLGAFRHFRAERDKAYAARHGGAARKQDLGFDLIGFFLPELSQQATWAIIFICLQYLPPNGLRLLLQYVNDRGTDSAKPTHVAYLYVAMMAVGQCFGVCAMGQSLLIGRRLCIRIRSIIITEVFTKAVRRREITAPTKKTVIGKDGKPVEDPAVAAASGGKIANFVSVDAFQISEICAYSFYIVSCPFAVIVNATFLYRTLGLASFAGIAVLLLLIPIQALVSRLLTVVQRKFLAATDARLEAVTEVIAHIKLIKFNAWEDKFYDRMEITRKKELAVLARRFGIFIMTSVIIWGTPVFVTSVAFSVHTLVLKKPLTADRAFSSLVLFNMLRDPLALFQDTLTRLIQSYTSCGRIQAFLDEPDTPKYEQLSAATGDEPVIGFRGAVVGYTTSEDMDTAEFEPFLLGEMDLSFPVGELSIVVGPVGSGKTTLLASLLGETMLLDGKIFMPDDKANREACPVDPATGLSDTVAYCAQTAWLVGASIKDNITFGQPWDEQRYNSIVDACALRKDFQIFDMGDDTEVGEKGTTCSGGQKARISLARALYSSAKTILLDDVLSAVDAQTGRHLYENCLQGPLVKGRTIILVTHSVNLVASAAAYVVMLDSGAVVAAGSPSELVAEGLLDLHEEEAANASSPSEASSSAGSIPTDDTKVDLIEENLDGVEGDALDTAKQVNADKAAPEVANLDKQLVATETQGKGTVGWATYRLCFKEMGGLFYWVLVIGAFILAQVAQVSSSTAIRDWANADDARQSVRTYLQTRSTGFYVAMYISTAMAFVVMIIVRNGVSMYGSLTASHGLYAKLLRRILGAKMRFFDSTPSGRIMNRLSKDMSTIDIEATEIMLYFGNTCFSVIAIIIVVVFSTPAFLLAMVVISAMYWVVGVLYVTTSREIKRMDSVTRSPLFISFSEALVGMSTIRAYGDSARFVRKIFQELDQNLRCFWYLWQLNRVLNNFSNFVGSLVTISACVLALNNPMMSAGAVGFTITYALSFTDYVLWVVRLYAACEMSMNSVERVAEYLDLEVEEETDKKGIEPPAYWPTKDGSVVVENLTCRYAPQLDPVLRDVSFTIGPKEKIGICGRTGSGKSTLALSFFRFLHQESGRIVIDGLDISKLSLTTLRSRLTILPQEAQLFSGTIRDNLDPFTQHEDYEIWEALRQCGLAGKTPFTSRAGSRADLKGLAATPASTRSAKARLAGVNSRLNLRGNLTPSRAGTPVRPSTPTSPLAGTSVVAGAATEDVSSEAGEGDADGSEYEVEERVTIRSLDEKVETGGKNFSQGQRQLLALARGLLKLRQSSFLVMDESTANLDHWTDQKIQTVLRTSLRDTQMLVIAHRLLTVCGLDKILVLDHGKVVEFGTPWELMQKEGGAFRDLCKQSGEEAQLLEMAKAVHEAKQRGEVL